MKFQIIINGLAAAAVSFSFTGSFAGCGLEECLNVGSDDAEDFIECASRSFDESEFIAPVDAEYLRANLRRFAERLKAMKEAEEQDKEITNEMLEEFREAGAELKAKLTVEIGQLSSSLHDSPATTNESAETELSPAAVVHPLERKPSEAIPITPNMGRQRAATDSIVDMRPERQMAYSYVAETPKSVSLIDIAKLKKQQRFPNIFAAPELDPIDDKVEEEEVEEEKSDYDLDLGGLIDEKEEDRTSESANNPTEDDIFEMDDI